MALERAVLVGVAEFSEAGEEWAVGNGAVEGVQEQAVEDGGGEEGEEVEGGEVDGGAEGEGEGLGEVLLPGD